MTKRLQYLKKVVVLALVIFVANTMQTLLAQTITITAGDNQDIGVYQLGEESPAFSATITWTGLNISEPKSSYRRRIIVTDPDGIGYSFSTSEFGTYNAYSLTLNTSGSASGSATLWFKFTGSIPGSLSNYSPILIKQNRLPNATPQIFNYLTVNGATVGYVNTVADGDLSDPGNNDAGSVLDEYVSVNIYNSMLINAMEDLNIDKLTILSGGALSIANNGSITTVDSFCVLNNGILADYNPTGGVTVGGSTIVQKIFDSESGTRGYYVGPIANSQTAASFGLSGTNRLWTWSEVTNAWSEITSSSTSLIPGVGYAFRSTAAPHNDTIMFAGGFVTGDVSQNITYTSLSGKRGWNLLSNPYPCPIDWNHASLTKDSVSNNTIQYRTNGSFATYNGNTMVGTNGGQSQIPAGQAFWVKHSRSGGAAGTVTFTTASKLTSNGATTFYSTPERKIIRLRLFSGSSVTQSDDAVSVLINGATKGYDKFDSDKYLVNTLPQIFALTSDSTELAIESQNLDLTDTVTYRYAVQVPTTGSYRIVADDFIGIDANIGVMLYDKLLGQWINLNATPEYTFTQTKNNGTGVSVLQKERFLLKIYPESITGTPLVAVNNEFKVWSANQQFIFNSNEKLNGVVQIFDLAGRKLHESALNVSGNTSLNHNLRSGIYLVRYISDKFTQTNKLFVD